MEDIDTNVIEIEEVVELDVDIEDVVELEVDVEQIGPRGLSVYEVYLQNGGTLSEIEWLSSLKGETGNSGVYIGEEEPDDSKINVWIDTSDNSIVLYAEKEEF